MGGLFPDRDKAPPDRGGHRQAWTSPSDLQGSIWVNEDEIPGDGIDNDGNGFVDDVNGWNFYSNTNQVYEGPEDVHGTHAAGTIAASRITAASWE